jgi:hypothetical protein
VVPRNRFQVSATAARSPNAGDQVARAKNHIEAFEDESDEMPKHERLSRAADLLRSAAETMRPRGEGSQHLARR